MGKGIYQSGMTWGQLKDWAAENMVADESLVTFSGNTHFHPIQTADYANAAPKNPANGSIVRLDIPQNEDIRKLMNPDRVQKVLHLK